MKHNTRALLVYYVLEIYFYGIITEVKKVQQKGEPWFNSCLIATLVRFQDSDGIGLM